MSHDSAPPVLEVRSVSKWFGRIEALADVTMSACSGSVTCLLGDNGAGKSTLVGILAGTHRPSGGDYLIDGAPVVLRSPRDAMKHGIATVHQDLALVPLMSIWRNFFLGAEPTVGRGPLKRLARDRATEVVRSELERIGISVRDTNQAVGTLSGGERQSLAIARALYLGARVLILDEPTAALGVKQSEIVLNSVASARDRGVAVILITHNPGQAYPVGDRFVILRRGRLLGDFRKGEITLGRLAAYMAGEPGP